MAVAEFDFHAMGGTAKVLVVGGRADLLVRARLEIERLEARWSRFRPDSEVSRLNATRGVPVVVSELTFLLVSRAVEGWRMTDGRYDPTVLGAIERLGYTRSFELVVTGCPSPTESAAAAPGCARIVLDPIVRAVTLPEGIRFDPGGIGKGLAADLVTAELLEQGAAGALVSLGGDLCLGGEPPNGDAWVIAVEDPDAPDEEIAHIELAAGGVATSSRRSRAWRSGGRAVHHLIDPRTGLPGDGPTAVTAIAADAWVAEVSAKAAMIAGDAAATLRDLGCRGVVVEHGGAVHEVVAA